MTSKKTVVKASVHSYENDRVKKYKNVFLVTSTMLVNYRITLLNSFVATIDFFFFRYPTALTTGLLFRYIFVVVS
jgi:hypothetical protein